MSMEAFINGRSVISSTGGFAAADPADQRVNENKLARNCSSSIASGDGGSNHDDAVGLDDSLADNNCGGVSSEGDNIALAERTSQLMSSYRSYISKADDEEALMSRIYDEGGSGGNNNFNNARVGMHQRGGIVGAATSAADGYSDSPLLRDWNAGGAVGELERRELERRDTECALWDDDEDENENGDNGLHCARRYRRYYRYSHPVFRSRKFKKFLTVFVLAVGLVWIVAVAAKDGRESRMASWDEEVKEVLMDEEEEDREEEGTLPHLDVGIGTEKIVGVDIQRGPGGMDNEESPAGNLWTPPKAAAQVQPGSAEEEPVKGDPAKEEPAMEEPAMEEPAKEEQAGEDEDQSNPPLATFEVKGEDDTPEDAPTATREDAPGLMIQEVLGWNKDDGDVGPIPFHDVESAAAPDVTKGENWPGNTVDGIAPDLDPSDGAAEEQTGKSPENGEAAAEDDGKPKGAVPAAGKSPGTGPANDAMGPTGTVSDATSKESSGMAAKKRDEAVTRHILCCSASSANADSNNNVVWNNHAAEEYARAEAYHPTWYDRSSGWRSTTYRAGLDFCASQRELDGSAKRLCPYEAYCPTGGAGHIPLGGFREEEDASSSRSPISDYPDGWVQVGSENACMHYTIFDSAEDVEEAYVEKDAPIAAAKPVLDGVGQIGIEQNESGVTDIIGQAIGDQGETGLVVEETYVPISKDEQQQVAVATTTSAPTPAPTPRPSTARPTLSPKKQEQFNMASVLHQKFKPLWLSSGDGWNGGSHSDAVSFCASVRGKRLCPYSAMCPGGPGGAVMGGRHELEFEVEGEQYAPVVGGDNHWVMIGSKGEEEQGDGDGAAIGGRCKTHRQLEGRAPAWGLTADRAEVKQYVMCCTVN